MKKLVCLFLLVLLLIPLQTVSANGRSENSIRLYADQVTGANDIEAAILQVTADGKRAGTVILDGWHGPFVFSGDDRSINIFVSNLKIRGVNQAILQNCADGLFFDNFPIHDILVENITFLCEADGVVAPGSFLNVTLRKNVFQASNFGIGVGGASSGWVITDNQIQADNGILLEGVSNSSIANNRITAINAVMLVKTSGSMVRNNDLQAADLGISLEQGAWQNQIQANLIRGVSQSGIHLELGVHDNLVVGNKVRCGPGLTCLVIDASAETLEVNKIEGNRFN